MGYWRELFIYISDKSESPTLLVSRWQRSKYTCVLVNAKINLTHAEISLSHQIAATHFIQGPWMTSHRNWFKPGSNLKQDDSLLPRYLYTYWTGNAILTKFSSLVAPKVVKMTTFGAANDKNFVKMTFPVQCAGFVLGYISLRVGTGWLFVLHTL